MSTDRTVRAAFLNFLASQGYDDQVSFDRDALELAFDAGRYVQAAVSAHSTDITIPAGETVAIHLPGSTAIKVDARHRVIAVDCVSMTRHPDEPLMPDWLVADLRQGMYGDFHALTPAAECNDADHARSGEHATAAERASLRDTLGAVQAVPVDGAR